MKLSKLYEARKGRQGLHKSKNKNRESQEDDAKENADNFKISDVTAPGSTLDRGPDEEYGNMLKYSQLDRGQ